MCYDVLATERRRRNYRMTTTQRRNDDMTATTTQRRRRGRRNDVMIWRRHDVMAPSARRKSGHRGDGWQVLWLNPELGNLQIRIGYPESRVWNLESPIYIYIYIYIYLYLFYFYWYTYIYIYTYVSRRNDVLTTERRQSNDVMTTTQRRNDDDVTRRDGPIQARKYIVAMDGKSLNWIRILEICNLRYIYIYIYLFIYLYSFIHIYIYICITTWWRTKDGTTTTT